MKLLSLVLVSAAHLALVQASAQGNGFGLDNMVQRTSYVTPQTPPAAGGPSTATGNSGSSSQTPATTAPATPATTAPATPATTMPQCSDACGALYQPVCGSDGKTYSNECSLSVASCKNPELKLMVQSSGACTQGAAQVTPPSDGDAASPSTASGSTTTAPVTSTCKQTCSKIRKPVCGSDGNTYSNLCLLKNAQCDNSKIVQMADDKCSSTTTSTGGSSASTGTSTGDSSTSTSTSTGDSKGPVTSTGGSGSTSSTKCTTMCTMDLDPVCGSDGKTYSNPCALKNAQCENPTSNIVLKATGACQSTTSPGGPGSLVNQGSATGGTGTSSSVSSCPSICTADYKPVCGSDGKTYSNKCQLSIAKCKNPTSNISLQSEGKCVANTASPGSSTGGSSSTTTGSSASTSGKTGTKGSSAGISSNSATTGSSTTTTTTATTGSTTITGSSTSTSGNSGTTGSSTSGSIATGTKQPLPTEPVKVIPSKCEMVCTKEYAPVCGSNGKTYTNSCALKLANCKSGKKEITIRSEGACVKPSTSTLQKPSGSTSTITSTSGSIAPVSGTGSSLASGSTTTTTTSKGSGSTTSTTTGTTGTTGASTTATVTPGGKGTYLRGPASGNSPVQGNY